MRLYKIREAVTWIDPFGDAHRNLTQYVRVLEAIDGVEKNGEWKMLDNGYEPPYQIWVYEAPDGRKWVEVTNRIDFWGGTWYRPLFDEPRDPALDKHEIGPRVAYLTEKQVRNKRCVNYDGKAVDLEGNLL